VVDADTGLVKKGPFSSLKDHYLRKSSCYDTSMVALVQKCANALQLSHSLNSYHYKKLIKDTFWTGSYFLDDLSGSAYVAGDANVFPYWCECFTSSRMMKSSLEQIQEHELDRPFPLKYTSFHSMKNERFPQKYLAPNYEGNSIWMHLGLCFLYVVKKVDRVQCSHYVESYRKLIEKHHNFLEVFDPSGRPYKTLLYKADQGMLWSAMFLDLLD